MNDPAKLAWRIIWIVGFAILAIAVAGMVATFGVSLNEGM